MEQSYKKTPYIWILIVLSYFFFIFGNNRVSLTNPDEVFYTQTAREMVAKSSWSVPYLFDGPNFEKPIFLYWAIRLGFIMFGENAFAARFFPAAFALIGVVAAYYFALLGFRDKKKAFLCAWVLMTSGFYIGLARTVFTDMIFSVWILLALLSFYWGYVNNERKNISIILFFAAAAFAVLTKGPLGILLTAMAVISFLGFRRELKYAVSPYTLWGIGVFLAIAVPWYAAMIRDYGTIFTQEFFYNDHIRRLLEAEHGSHDTWYFYPYTMFVSMYPWTLFTAAALFFLIKNKQIRGENPFYLFTICWIVCVLGVFQVAHSKLTSYIFPLFPALALLTGNYLSDVAGLQKTGNRTVFILTWITFLIFPIGLPVGLILFPGYIHHPMPVYVAVALFVLLLWVLLLFILRRELFRTAILMGFVLFVLLFMAFFIKDDIEPHLSSNAAAEIVAKNADKDAVVMSSKMFARGIRYYTDRKIAVVAGPGSTYFSPHPILMLDSDKKIKSLLESQKITYGVLKKSALEDVRRAAGKEFSIEELGLIGDAHVVRVSKNQGG